MLTSTDTTNEAVMNSIPVLTEDGIFSREQLRRHFEAQTAGDHLGDITYWMLSNADVPRTVLEDAWRDNGMDMKFLPEVQTPEKALRAAVKEYRAAPNNGKSVLLRQAFDSKDMLIFGVVEEERVGAGELDYKQVSRVELNKVSGVVNVTAQSSVTQAIVAKFQENMQITPARDVMSTIVRVLKSFRAVTLRDTGGIYWVPNKHSAGLRALQGAVRRIGQSALFLLPVHRTVEAVEALQAAADAGIEADLKALGAEIEEFKADLDGTRPSTLERRLQTFQELRERAHLYQTVLTYSAEGVGARIVEMETAVSALLGMKRVAK